MADGQDRTCPECQGPMAPILLMDKVTVNKTHMQVEYALPGVAPGRWTGRLPVAGTVDAFMCARCGRITLYGVPKLKE